MRQFLLIPLICFLASCTNVPKSSNIKKTDAYAQGYSIDKPISCVPYARDVSGIPIRGNAHTWWYQAQNGAYQCSQQPRKGAVYVLSKSKRLKYGHVSVVTDIIDSRTIEVTHSNWGNNKERRSFIYERMRVQDLSPNNDWTLARFWNPHINSWGLPYIASGFIYPN